MVTCNLPETRRQFKPPNTEQLLTILENQPAKGPALTLGIVVSLAKNYYAERKKETGTAA